MTKSDFEGSLVLEKLAQIGKIDAFIDAVDSDQFQQARSLMTDAGIDSETINIVLRKMAESEGGHES